MNKLSPSMLKVLEEIKNYSLWLAKARITDIKAFKKKATKKKTLMAIFKVAYAPIFELYVNNKFYASFIFDGKKWKEEK